MKRDLSKLTTGKKSKYAAKKERMKNGTYTGSSPFYNNIAEFQFLKPLSCYPHLAMYNLPNVKDDNRMQAA